jgi:hypothetical protein
MKKLVEGAPLVIRERLSVNEAALAVQRQGWIKVLATARFQAEPHHPSRAPRRQCAQEEWLQPHDGGNRDEYASISIPRRGRRDPSVPRFPRSRRLAIQSTPLRSGPTARISRVRTRCSVGNGHAFLRGAGEEDRVRHWSINRLRECLTDPLTCLQFTTRNGWQLYGDQQTATNDGAWPIA